MPQIGDILDTFFSPFSSEKLWIMPENDNYTKIVRTWQPVVNSTIRIKASLKIDCVKWSKNFRSDPKWKPSKTDNPKARAHRDFVPSPPGTDPATCKSAFIVYVSSKAVKAAAAPLSPTMRLFPEIQTRNLYTCSVGSFNIYTTVDAIDCTKKTASVNFWMYNSMSKRSFGKFASHPAFALSGMKTQFMWWNWIENVDWSSGKMSVAPRSKLAKPSG